MISIQHAETAADMGNARSLFREYETWLDMDLCFQGFEEEVRGLPGRYSKPEGRLLLATAGTKLAGCVAMRMIEDEICEMKRLYLRKDFRGIGLGNALIDRVIEEARGIGYKKMRLDTYPPKMGKAVKLYESYGFNPIPPYYHNPHAGVLFMELDL